MESTLEHITRTMAKILNIIAGAALTFMMCLTVADVLMRAGGHPILGVYEMVSLSLAVVIGFSIPQVSLDRGHVYMEFILEILSARHRALLNTFTRVLCIILFVILGYNLFLIGNEFRTSGEISSTLKLPFYPIAYCVGICCFMECLVFMLQIAKIWREKDE